MKVTIKYFASIREAIGTAGEQRETDAATLGDLRSELIATSPAHAEALAHGRAVRMAVDQVMSNEAAALQNGCEVAFFPPVTGG